MTCTKEDLGYIFIRAQDKKGKQDSFSVKEATTFQFRKWIYNRFEVSIEILKNNALRVTNEFIVNNPAIKKEYSLKDKLDIIKWLANRGSSFAMVARDKRKNWDKT